VQSCVRYRLTSNPSQLLDFHPLLPDLLDETDVELMQNMSCKVDSATLKPAQYPANPELEW